MLLSLLSSFIFAYNYSNPIALGILSSCIFIHSISSVFFYDFEENTSKKLEKSVSIKETTTDTKETTNKPDEINKSSTTP
jgi:hypothetical protein